MESEMPQLANDILDDNLASPSMLYVRLGRKGDDPRTTVMGAGGLGKAFNSDLALLAFNINSRHRTVSSKALNIQKLWELCLAFKSGSKERYGISHNSNKEIICLAFLIKQDTTNLETAAYQEQAYLNILHYYKNKTGYKGQVLQPKSESATTVEDKINELRIRFEGVKARLEQTRGEELEQSIHAARSLSGGSQPYGERELQLQSHSQMRTSTSDPSISSLRGSTSYISLHMLDASRQGEEKPETKIEARENIKYFLYTMEKDTIPTDGTQLSLRDIKTAQKVFFLVKVPKLTLLQLRALSYLMDTVQTHAPTTEEQKRFNYVRQETSFWRRLFQGTHGNTKTFEAMANKVQTTMLHKLTQQEFHNKYPNDKLEEFDLDRIVEPMERIPLDEQEFLAFQGLFKPSFDRWPNRRPAVLDNFNNRFVSSSPRHGSKR
jgi:hypothetical protein